MRPSVRTARDSDAALAREEQPVLATDGEVADVVLGRVVVVRQARVVQEDREPFPLAVEVRERLAELALRQRRATAREIDRDRMDQFDHDTRSLRAHAAAQSQQRFVVELGRLGALLDRTLDPEETVHGTQELHRLARAGVERLLALAVRVRPASCPHEAVLLHDPTALA